MREGKKNMARREVTDFPPLSCSLSSVDHQSCQALTQLTKKRLLALPSIIQYVSVG